MLSKDISNQWNIQQIEGRLTLMFSKGQHSHHITSPAVSSMFHLFYLDHLCDEK